MHIEGKGSEDYRIGQGIVNIDLGNLKFRNLEYTQVAPEKGWFCMLIFELLHCIVHVTSTWIEVPTPTQMCRG